MAIEKIAEKEYGQTLKICGLSADEMMSRLEKIEALSSGDVYTVQQGIYGDISFEIIAKADTEKDAKKILKPVIREVKSHLGKYIYATEADKTLEEATVELLKAQGLSLALAESCTGGMIAARIVNVPGASEVFCEGFVTYTEKAKRKRLLVKKSTLKNEGVVSAKTAKEMAKGGCFTSGADACVSVTGLAGPDGGSKSTPVGTVFIGCCIKGDVDILECHFTGDRNDIRKQAVVSALAFLRDCVLKTYKKK